MWDKKGYVVYSEMLNFYLHHRVQMTHLLHHHVQSRQLVKALHHSQHQAQEQSKEDWNILRITVFKGMNNFIYGKFLQNVFKQTNLKFLNTIEDAIQTQSMPGFVCNTFHNGNFTIADI